MHALLQPAPAVLPSPPLPAPVQATREVTQRYVWESRFGSMLIEIVAGTIFVNGSRVESHRPPT